MLLHGEDAPLTPRRRLYFRVALGTVIALGVVGVVYAALVH